jgi:tetratricopeptide (TPR) repeat protein
METRSMDARHGRFRVLAALLAVSASRVDAQSIVVLGSGEDARRCSQAAEIAATVRIASDDDLKHCDLALELAALRPRDRAGTLVNRGILQSVLGDNRAAVADYDRALALRPELPEAYVGRGNVRFIERDIPGAIAEYDRALALGTSRRHVVLLNRGMALEAKADLDAAERDYRAALELSPGWPPAQSRLDRVLARRKAVTPPPP